MTAPAVKSGSSTSGAGSRWLTTRCALSGCEWVTSLAAAAVSTSAYLRYGRAYLGPGVVGDLAGLAVLGAIVRRRHARVRHESAFCLACIGLVVAARQERLERLPEPLLWGSFGAGLSAYLAARQRACP